MIMKQTEIMHLQKLNLKREGRRKHGYLLRIVLKEYMESFHINKMFLNKSTRKDTEHMCILTQGGKNTVWDKGPSQGRIPTLSSHFPVAPSWGTLRDPLPGTFRADQLWGPM